MTITVQDRVELVRESIIEELRLGNDVEVARAINDVFNEYRSIALLGESCREDHAPTECSHCFGDMDAGAYCSQCIDDIRCIDETAHF